jgi:hypothetical protein
MSPDSKNRVIVIKEQGMIVIAAFDALNRTIDSCNAHVAK